MLKHGRRWVLLAPALVLAVAAAQAARPLQTDDAGVLDRGVCESQALAPRLTEAGQSTSERSLEVACGWGWNSQIAVAGIRSDAEGQRTQGLALAGKTRLWQASERDDAAALTLSWQIRSEKQPQDSWRHVGTGLNLLYSAPLAAIGTVHLQLGHGIDEQDGRRTTSWGLALEHAAFGEGGRWAPMAEVYGDDRGRPWWSGGLRLVAIADRLLFDASYGRRFSAGRETLLTFGVKLIF
jgi:hypothetical protein